MERQQTHEDIWSLSEKDRSLKRQRSSPSVVGVKKYGYYPNESHIWDRPEWRHYIKKSISYERRGSVLDDETIPRYEVRQPTHGSGPSLRYASRTPYPTYSQFGKPTMVDTLGRQYKWGDGSDAKLLQKMGKISGSRGRPSIKGQSALIYIRFPKGKRGMIDYPEPGTILTVYDIRRKLIYSGKVEWIEGDDPVTSATGSVFLTKVTNVGVVDEDTIGDFSEAVSKLPKKYQIKF